MILYNMRYFFKYNNYNEKHKVLCTLSNSIVNLWCVICILISSHPLTQIYLKIKFYIATDLWVKKNKYKGHRSQLFGIFVVSSCPIAKSFDCHWIIKGSTCTWALFNVFEKILIYQKINNSIILPAWSAHAYDEKLW